MILPGYKSGLLSRTRFGPLAIKIGLNTALKKKHRFRIVKNTMVHHTVCARGKVVQTDAITKWIRAMPHKKGLRIGLTILTVLAALMSMPMVMFSPMMFDAPGSDENVLTQFLFFSVLAFPVLCLMGGILPWVFKRHPNSIWLYGLSGLALTQLLLAITLIQTQCGGNFSC